MSGIEKMERLRVRRDTAGSLEVDRIIRLPIVGPLAPEEVEAFSEQEVDARYFREGFRILPLQAKAILDFDSYGGCLCPIPVGQGKTLVSLMVVNRAFRGGIERTILLVPPDVYPQLTQADITWARRRVGLSVPFILMGDKPLKERERIVRSQKIGCYVMPHTLLSTRDTDMMLEGIRPGLVVIDEAHKFRRRQAARTRRLLGFLQRHQPALVALSGTMTKKSLRDYGHLAIFALREHSPLPMDVVLIDQWAQAIDAGADPSDAQTGPIRPLLTWFTTHWPGEQLPPHVAGYRAAYNRRFVTCPGVVAGDAAEIGCSLIIKNSGVAPKTDDDYERMREMMKRVEELWLTPSGDAIDWGFHKWKYLWELTSGFYFNLRWPSVEELRKRSRYKRMTDAEVEGYLLQAQDHHAALQEYHRRLRRWLEHQSRTNLDTPMLVGQEMARNGAKYVGAHLFEAWDGARGLEFEEMPERVSEPTLVCRYKIDAAVAWAKENGPGLVWYYHDPIGRWIHEAMVAAGVDALWVPAESRQAGMNDLLRDEDRVRGKVLVISMSGHGTGKNLQTAFSRQMFVQFPRQSDTAEQVIGRTHRLGQPEDEVLVFTINTTPFDHYNMGAALVDALYHHQTVGAKQKLIYATYDPLPFVYPDDFLRERGFLDVQRLTREHREALEEKFGKMQET